MNYNLLEEKWIPVLWKDGKTDRVGILDALTQAARVRQIAASNPMDRVAILRFLLAVLYWCKGNPPDDSIPADSFPREWFTKLEENKDCFNLLGGGKRFYQDHSAGGRPVAATNLLQDLPSGTNIAHFRHVRDFRDGLCPACCALALLRWATFASAGTAGPGQQMTASLHGNTPTYYMRSGTNLFETLRLNWRPGKPTAGDLPSWEGASEASPLGVLKALTWQSRRVLLAPPDANGNRDFSVGNCCYCASESHQLVKSILFRPGWRRPSKEPWWDDPHLLLGTAKDRKGKDKKVLLSLPGPDEPTEAHASFWRSVSQALFQRAADTGPDPTQFDVTLVSTSQQLFKDAVTHTATIPLRKAYADVLIEEIKWLGQLIWTTSSARTAEWHKRPRGHAIVEALCSKAAQGHAIRSSLCDASFRSEEKLEQAFRNLTKDLASCDGTDVDSRTSALQRWIMEVGKTLSDHVSQVAELTTKGSPLRRHEANIRATDAVATALRGKIIAKERNLR